MADHVRQQIRDAVVTLVTGLTTTGTNVFASRVWPIQPASLPGLLVYLERDDVEYVTMGLGNRRQARTAEIIIEALVQGTSNIDNTLDTIGKEVETALAADPVLSGLAKEIRLDSAEFTFEGQGEKPLASNRMTFSVDYQTAENDPTVVI